MPPDQLPFLFGAQYYRAPTPAPDCWDGDLRRMRDLGCNAVKFWVQWRWSHRAPDRFFFDDVDRLMDLAAANGLAVTLNTIFDVSPLWLFEHYPDAKQVMNHGWIVEPRTVAHRQIGGHPGPCYNHPGALAERRRFLAATVEHFRGHPALSMWDVWNEPEQCFFARTPEVATLVCYCAQCAREFTGWLRDKYGNLSALNTIWGRCYEDWGQVELPREPHTITDFIDWREFQLDTMTSEARLRLRLTKELDPAHVVYLHVVPNTMSPFNAVTCVDDFALAPDCDVFAATMNGGPNFPVQVASAAPGKVCYNVESHVNGGCLTLQPRVLELPDLLRDFLPQIGLGVKGFLFWQFRAETLGFESPAWGLVRTDGSDRPVTRAAEAFWKTVGPHANALMRCAPRTAEVGIWKSRRNEIFHFCAHGNLEGLRQSVDAYVEALYWSNRTYRFIDSEMLADGRLDGLRALILPSPYFLTQPEADALDRWVKAGGVAFSEAPLAGYDGTRGRHAGAIPGCGLAQAWGLRESESTSSYHLKLDAPELRAAFAGAATADAKKALADFGTTGGVYFPIVLGDGTVAWGAHRGAFVEGDGANVLGRFGGEACIVSKAVGQGTVFYVGTNLGVGATKDASGLKTLLDGMLLTADVSPTAGCESVPAGSAHIDVLREPNGEERFLVALNGGDEAVKLRLKSSTARWRALFSGARWAFSESQDETVELPPRFVDLFVRED